MMIKGMGVDDSMSNLTSASHEASLSSGNRDEQSQPPAKKRRNLPGNPAFFLDTNQSDPLAEVIALSPRSLLATNRFMCEVCGKGFQRDQNLQLHRRGHNLPWKLKQRNNKEVIRKKVYVCPEVTCVHHDPSRALGDLTGIKKHFCRKHGEKKWNCEKCSKRYAVHSDWKAHSKICGTREYRCECGTIFSRRDSFITHRAFCDALTEEKGRTSIISNPVSFLQPAGASTSHQLSLHGSFSRPLKREDFQQPDGRQCSLPSEISPSNFFNPRLEESIMQQQHQNSNPNNLMLVSSNNFLQPTAAAMSPHMSATALLQKAAAMGVTMSKSPNQSKAMLRPHQVHMSTTTGLSSTSLATSIAGSCLGLSSREEIGDGFFHGLASFGNKSAITSSCMEQVGATIGGGVSGPPNSSSLLVHDMNNITSNFPSASLVQFQQPSFIGGSNFDGILNSNNNRNFQQTLPRPKEGSGSGRRGGNEGLTRDFLGLTPFPNSTRGQCDLFIADLHQMGSSYGHQNHQS